MAPAAKTKPVVQTSIPTYAAFNDFADEIEALPADLVRNFTLLREVDSKTVLLQTELITEIRRFMDDLPIHKSKRDLASKQLVRIKELILQGFAYSDEKVSVASTAADVVSRHMIRLERDFAMVEEEVPRYIREGSPPPALTLPIGATTTTSRKHRVEASTPRKQSAKAVLGAALRDETATPQPVVSRHGRQSKPRRRSVSPVPVQRLASNATIVNDEDRTYCYCQQVSYGAMVACDSAGCLREWFHLACVNLDAPPRGQWYCDDCKRSAPPAKRRRAP